MVQQLLHQGLWSPFVRRVSAPLLVFVVAAGVSTVGAGGVSIWTDEAVSISAASRDWPQLWQLLQRIDAVHGVYYGLLKVWITVFGLSPLSIRFLSALAVGGTALGVFVLCCRYVSARSAMVAALLCAVLPRMTWAGIEGRPFALSALAAVWVTVAFSTALLRPRPVSWVSYGLFACAGVYANVYLALLVMAHGVTVLIGHRQHPRVWGGYVIAGAAAAIASLPLIMLARSQQAQVGEDGERGIVGLLRRILINQNFLGETPSLNPLSFIGTAPAEPYPGWFTLAWQGSAIVAAATGVVLITVGTLRTVPGDREKRALITVVLPWAVLPPVLVAGYAMVIAPMYQPRYFTFAAPAVAVLVAFGVRVMWRHGVGRVVVCLFVVACLVVVGSQRVPYAKSGSDWASAAQVVAAQAQRGDGVYYAPNRRSDDPSQYNARRMAVGYPLAYAGLDDVTMEASGADTATFDGTSIRLADAQERVIEHDRVWAVYMRSTDPAILSADRGLFTEWGYEGRTVWRGPGSIVIEYARR
ncbi:glycosyltransferase family 39 protein [Microbacterium sp.]|uniref:glycosyltransferase family 39 protein n=1 Tax=Microbacterium sp. TaxID=51671 RepID=UPI003A931151